MLGSAKRVTIDKDNTTIVDGAGDARRDQGPDRSDPPADREHQQSDYDKEKLQERLAKLAGGVAVIKVGGSSEIEVKERKDRVDDALHATRAAVEEGIVPGGGVALLYATKALDGLNGANDDQTRGIDIIRRALQSPIRQIAENAGVDGAVVAGKLIDGNDETMGFNAQTEVYENLVTGRRDRSDQGRPHRAPGRGLGRGPAHHHRSGGERSARGQGSGRPGDAGRRHGRHGFLSPAAQAKSRRAGEETLRPFSLFYCELPAGGGIGAPSFSASGEVSNTILSSSIFAALSSRRSSSADSPPRRSSPRRRRPERERRRRRGAIRCDA